MSIRPLSSAIRRIRSHDPGAIVVRRSIRAAVVMPAVFGLTHLLFHDPQVGLFGAFGSFSLLLLVDFVGRPSVRLASYLTLFGVGTCFVVVGTLLSTDKVASVVGMAVIGFGVLYAGILSAQAAAASVAGLLLFVLPVAVAGHPSAVGPRLEGWTIAAAACITACMLIWPTPWHDELRRRLSATIGAVGLLAGAYADGRVDPDQQAAVRSELGRLRDEFRASPLPESGSASAAVALAKLVGRVEWVAGSAMLNQSDVTSFRSPAVSAVVESASETLRLSALVICDGTAHPVADPVLTADLLEAIGRLDRLVSMDLDTEVEALVAAPVSETTDEGQSGRDRASISEVDPSFRARALGIATEMVADAALESIGVQDVGDRRIGGAGRTGASRPHPVVRRLTSHLSFGSVWFRNALRGAAGLALAVAVVELTDVEHGFWVVLGTLSVLRSNALDTGSTALRAVTGTAIGFVIGSAVMIGVGAHSVLLWVLLPLAVLVSGVAPSMISFAAGQAAFTLMVVILFNIIEPVGWKVGLTRIEDVAIGCGVSIGVGLLFWPRGAKAALGRALSAAFVASSAYLADAVDRLTPSTHQVDTDAGQLAAHTAYLRLDDAFRQYVAERGTKAVPVETVAGLCTGTNRIRLAAFTLAGLPVVGCEPGRSELESVAVAGAVLRDSYAASHHWYEQCAAVLGGHGRTLGRPPDPEATLHGVLLHALDDARLQGRTDRLRTTLQMMWAEELLVNQGTVQAELAAAADRFVGHGAGIPPV